MKLPFRVVTLGLALAFSTTGAQAFELEHSNGTLNLATAPTRLVSYDLGVLDTLNTLDIPVVGVPKSTYQGSLAKYNDAPVVGTLFEPDYDALNQLKPDLIFAGGRSQRAIPKLKDVAPTVIYTADNASFLESFRQHNMALARAFGKSDIAAKALTPIDDNIKALHKNNKGKTAAFLFVINDTIIAHAPGDRFGYAYELTGLESVLPPKEKSDAPPAPRPEPGSPEAKAAQAQRAKIISAVAQADPDWLIVLDRGAINNGAKTAAGTLEKHPELRKIKAYRNSHVYYADPNGWYVVTGGLSNLQQITDDLLATMK